VFDLDELVARCIEAVSGGEPIQGVRAVLDEAISGRSLRVEPREQPGPDWLRIVYRSETLTVIDAVWPPFMTLFPHDHAMWAAIGVYRGQEDNTFYRRQAGTIAVSGGRSLGERDVLLMGADAIHAVENPSSNYTRAVHVYGGDFMATPRRQWDPETLQESPYDLGSVRAAFERAERASKGTSA
jgi:predicted metal-dependent enzyme (double-stranded beta helix superfamily)